MTNRGRASPPGPRSDDFKIGCAIGGMSGLVGVAIGTVALLVLRPDWVASPGTGFGAIVAGLLGGWAVALASAVVAGLILVAVMSALERARGRAPTRLNVALIFVAPAAVAAITLWLAASVNR